LALFFGSQVKSKRIRSKQRTSQIKSEAVQKGRRHDPLFQSPRSPLPSQQHFHSYDLQRPRPPISLQKQLQNYSLIVVGERSRSDAACVATWRRWYALYAWKTKSPPTWKLGSNDSLSSSKKMPGIIRMSMASRQPWDAIREYLLSRSARKHWLQNIIFPCHSSSIIHSCMALHYMYM